MQWFQYNQIDAYWITIKGEKECTVLWNPQTRNMLCHLHTHAHILEEKRFEDFLKMEGQASCNIFQ